MTREELASYRKVNWRNNRHYTNYGPDLGLGVPWLRRQDTLRK